MENEFECVVEGNGNFADMTLETFAIWPNDDINIFFDTSTLRGVKFKGKILALRNRYNSTMLNSQQAGKIPES